MPQKAMRYLVAGRVQGVFYRASTASKARELGLDGWAKNLPDGCVEVVASGEDAALAALARWLWQGPPAARVEKVRLEQWPQDVPVGFTTY
jgi:acylphosphatase